MHTTTTRLFIACGPRSAALSLRAQKCAVDAAGNAAPKLLPLSQLREDANDRSGCKLSFTELV